MKRRYWLLSAFAFTCSPLIADTRKVPPPKTKEFLEGEAVGLNKAMLIVIGAETQDQAVNLILKQIEKVDAQKKKD